MRLIATDRLLAPTAGLLLWGMSGAPAPAAVDFTRDIVPILRNSCVECHGPERQKGKLRLDAREHIFKGESGDWVVQPGKPEDSELYRRVTLPPDDLDIMPSEGDPLTKEQQELLRAWIDEGAEWPEGFVLEVEGAPTGAEGTLAEFKPAESEIEAVAQLESLGVSAPPVARNVNWRQVNFRVLGTNATDSTLVPLEKIAGLVDLNLAGTSITDAGLSHLAGLTNLTTLHLEKTGITGEGLKYLKDLGQLTYLNLYDTRVTDDALKHLEPLKSLKKLYLWQTEVTEEGVAALKAALPDAEINTGWELTALAKPEETEEEATRDEAEKPAKEDEKGEEKEQDKKEDEEKDKEPDNEDP
ncbi:MAG TPA: c-type cytochrome domain-containing protein [Methylomirabilota bacterium]|nr:c-type cytochrome domain-containing protein [Methylomirabilota bacterium]